MGRFRLSGRNSAMTLVEILVSTLLTSLILTMLWQLFGSGSKATAYGTWYSGRIAELRNGLRLLREDIGKATYASTITPTSVTVVDTDTNKHIGYKNSATPIMLTGGTQDLLVFHIQKPDRTAMPAPDNLQPADITCTLQARGTTLHYTKSGTGSVLAEETIDKDLIRDVEWVQFTLSENNGPDGEASLQIHVRCKHPQQPEKGVDEKTVAKCGIRRRPF